MKVRSEAAQTGMAARRIWRFGQRDGRIPPVLDGTSRNPTERNAADMPGSAAAAEACGHLFDIFVTILRIVGSYMASVGIKELKEKLSAYLNRVRHGEEIIVKDRGKEIANVIPISPERNAVRHLVDTGQAAWAGDKPRGLKGIKGKPLSTTILEDRR
jgi:prevent-host-death family protein